MAREAFEGQLEASWQVFREQLLQAFDFADGSARPNVSAETELCDSNLPKMLPKGPRDVNGDVGSLAIAMDTEIQEKAVFRVTSETSSMEEDIPGITHGDSSVILASTLSEMTDTEKRAIRHRLRVRLGQVTPNKLVSGKSLHDAVCALGLTAFSEEEMNSLVNHLASFIDLNFICSEENSSASFTSFSFLRTGNSITALGHPVWEWPKDGHSSHAHVGPSRYVSERSNLDKAPVVTAAYNVVPLQALMDVFLAKEGETVKKIFGKQILKQFKAIKEILLAGDTNRLVAELTNVRINDLAAPPEEISIMSYVEPFVALIIVVNGVMMAFQTDPSFESWRGWVYFELFFAMALSLELILRLLLVGCRDFWTGADLGWNILDFVLSMAAWVDVIIQLSWTESPDVIGTFLLRYFRLVRMARIVKIFRLTMMKDLRLMMRGLIAGVWTLALAFVLLFTVIYVIAGTATIALDTRKLAEIGLHAYFYNIPTTMFTAFRCFRGDCVNDQGHSLTSVLSREFGFLFVLGYIASYMLVTMGIFNVILAVYVEITMRSAKESDEQYVFESIGVARATRELLKKFAAAHHVFHILEDHTAELSQLEISQSATLFTDDELQDNIEISKELFLLVIQDRGVQRLMDDLDLPPNRAHLFEVIDADGSGTLQIQELLQGLLKLRKEVNKGDVVAPLLATKSVQDMVCSLRTDQQVNFERLHRELLTMVWPMPERRERITESGKEAVETTGLQPAATPHVEMSKLDMPVPQKPLMLETHPEDGPCFS